MCKGDLREFQSPSSQPTGNWPAIDSSQSTLDEALVRLLQRCELLEDAQNVVFVGGQGTDKTHLATAVGVQAIQHHHDRVRFLSTIELVNQLEQEQHPAPRTARPTG